VFIDSIIRSKFQRQAQAQAPGSRALSKVGGFHRSLIPKEAWISKECASYESTIEAIKPYFMGRCYGSLLLMAIQN